MRITTAFLCAVLAVASCAMARESHSQRTTVIVNIKDAQGKIVGKAVFSAAESGGVKLDLNITNLPPGSHAFHIHQKPVCDAAQDFDTSGLRFDPTGEFYGDTSHRAHSGPSAGDPGEAIAIGADRKGHASYVFPKLTLGNDDHSILRGDGTAIVFHSAAGAAGPTRIACGVITRTKQVLSTAK